MRNRFLLLLAMLYSALVMCQQSTGADKSSSLSIFDFSTCDSANYNLCFKNRTSPPIFDFSDCKDKIDVKKSINRQLIAYLFNNFDVDIIDAIKGNGLIRFQNENTFYSLITTFWLDTKGNIITDLISSNIKSSPSAHDKLKFLLSKIQLDRKSIPKGISKNGILNRQLFLKINLKSSDTSKDLKIYSRKKKKFNPQDSLVPPVFSECVTKERIVYTKEDFYKRKKCLEQFISQVVKENYNKNVFDHYGNKLTTKYRLYEKKIKTVTQFTLTKEGEVDHIKVIGLLPGLESEVVRIVKKIPALIKPATKRGVPKNISYSLPVTFTTPSAKR